MYLFFSDDWSAVDISIEKRILYRNVKGAPAISYFITIKNKIPQPIVIVAESCKNQNSSLHTKYVDVLHAH